jgi:phosphonate transport system substrate-binding protein
MRVFRSLLASILGVAALFPGLASAAPREYTVSVVPQFAPAQIYTSWQPLLDALEQKTGLRFKLLVYPTIPNFELAFTKGIPDFAFMNPYHVVMAHNSQGYIPLVRNDAPLSGILVVRADSDIRDIRQLDGKSVAFPAPNAFGAALYMRALLHRDGIHITPHYVGSHDNVYRAVARGDDAAGGGVAESLSREPAGLRAVLRVIYTTPKTAPHALAANPRVPEKDRLLVQQALLAMGKDPADAKILRHVQIAHPVAADYARDYAPLESLHLEKFVVQPQ